MEIYNLYLESFKGEKLFFTEEFINNNLESLKPKINNSFFNKSFLNTKISNYSNQNYSNQNYSNQNYSNQNYLNYNQRNSHIDLNLNKSYFNVGINNNLNQNFSNLKQQQSITQGLNNNQLKRIHRDRNIKFRW